MTLEEIVVAALARGLEFSQEVPTTRSVHFRRIRTREQQLYVRAAEINPDYLGVSVSIALAAGAADLSTLTTQAERITGVRINGVGTSGLTTGTRVNIVPVTDPSSGLSPRAHLRDYRLTQYSTELALVASVWIDYSKRAATTVVSTDVPGLPEQFHELLVIDDTKSMLRRTLNIDPDTKKLALSTLDAEEAEYLDYFDRHVERFVLAEQSRFGRTARSLDQPRQEA